MHVLRTTPVLFVEAIEPALAFWQDRLGYQTVSAVHQGERLAFVLLRRDADEVMLQTLGCWGDLPEVREHVHRVGAALLHEVDSLDEVLDQLDRFRLLAGPRSGSAGQREIILRDPASYVHVFSESPRA